MTPSRRWLVLPFVAACALLLCGPVVSQEPEPEKKQDDTKKPAEKTGASDKDIADLKKDLAATQKELDAAKKTLDAVAKANADSAKEIDAAKAAAKAAEATATAAKKAADATAKDLSEAKKDIAAAQKTLAEPKPVPGSDEAKKAIEDLKGADEAFEKAALDAAAATTAAAAAGAEGKDKGDTAWMLISSALVLFMVPGLALFYGGMVRRKNVLATMMQSMAALAIVGVYWIAIGYALAFGQSAIKIDFFGVTDGGIIGFNPDLVFLKGVAFDQKLPGYNIPVYVHVMFQGMFAIITPALISGAVAERIRFWPFCIFMILWVTFVYCPLAHMVWAFDWFDPKLLAAERGANPIGLLGKMGALDFAGGTVVHIAAGMAGLAACLVLKKRAGYPKTVTHPNSMVLTLLGAGLLWFGWFGFNGGSATGSGAQAVSAFTATQAAAAAAGLMWMLVEWIHKGKPTALGLASGIVAGLVAVTPASGYVYAWGGLAIGAIAAILCYLAVWVKGKLGYDDSLDAFGVHGVGGFVGAVLTGVFCTTMIYPAGGDGPFAYKYHRERATAIETKLLSEAEKEEGPAKDAVKKIEDEVKYDNLTMEVFRANKAVGNAPADKPAEKDAADKKLAAATSALKAADEKLVDPKKIATDKSATVTGLKDELVKLKKSIDRLDDKEHDGKDKKTEYSQTMIQLKAAGFSVVFAFVVSGILALLVQLMTLGNFRTNKKDETEGLDRSEHGEVGFDFGFATESVTALAEPRAAMAPSGNNRFDLAVEGVNPADLRAAWTVLCQPPEGPADPDFLAVYPFVTTMNGNKFRFRGGDAAKVAARLEALFKKKLPGKPVKVTRI